MFTLCFLWDCRGANIFSSFIKFLKSKDAGDGSEQALVDELKTFDDHLKAHVSDFTSKKMPLFSEVLLLVCSI